MTMLNSDENSVDRRHFLKFAAGSAAALVVNAPGAGAQGNTKPGAETAGDNPYTQGMAAFVSGLRYEQIPTEVIDRVKLLMLDSLGCAIYSVNLEWSRI